jgi:heme exporter protein B
VTGTLATARTIAAKDLAVERRSRIVANQVLPFAGLVMVMFAFALDDDAVASRVAGGLVWLAALLALLVTVQRSFAVDAADGALEAIRAAGADMRGVFLGKVAALAVQLLVLEAVLVAAAVVLYRVSVRDPLLLAAVLVAATAGLAAVGCIYGGVVAGAGGRETLLPLLLMPVAAPVLIGATRATESVFASGGATPDEGWPWVGLLAAFAAVFLVAGAMSFAALVEE